MPRKTKTDWPAVAAALATEITPADLHPAAMARGGRWTGGRTAGRSPRGALALSGGADSMALLLLLWAEGPVRRGRDLVVLHFNHRLRGRASDGDARFCRAVCRTLGVTCVSGDWKEARPEASAAEARVARHLFFAREMRRRRLRLLWLGHQQDDIAETMLMRLARGSGAGGLAAPRPVQELSDGRIFLRPLLTLKKTELLAALRRAGARWREDDSNGQPAHFRNRIRRDVVPAWRQVAGRDAVAGAALTRELLEEDEAALEAWVDRLRPVRRRVLEVGVLRGLPRAVARRALHRWLLAVRPDTDLSRQGFELLLGAVRRGTTTRFSLGRQGFAVIRRGKMVFRKD